MSEEREPYVVRTVELAKEMIEKLIAARAQLVDEGLAGESAAVLEVARLQAQLVDLRERNAILEQALKQSAAHVASLKTTNALLDARHWARAWKRAATVNWRARKRLQTSSSVFISDRPVIISHQTERRE